MVINDDKIACLYHKEWLSITKQNGKYAPHIYIRITMEDLKRSPQIEG